MLGQTGKNGNTVPREFQPQKLSFFIIIGSFILENKNKMVFLSSYSPVLHWPSKHLTSCQWGWRQWKNQGHSKARAVIIGTNSGKRQRGKPQCIFKL